MKQKDYQRALRLSGLGTQMIVLIGLGVWGGIKLDEKWHTSPWMLLLLSLIGLSISLYQVIKEVGRDNAKK